MITMTYYHTVTVFAGSTDPVKVTSYTQAEQDAYEAGLPSDATIIYSGTSAGDMRRAFKAAQTFTIRTTVADYRSRTSNLRQKQKVCDHDEIHTRDQIEAIAGCAWWN